MKHIISFPFLLAFLSCTSAIQTTTDIDDRKNLTRTGNLSISGYEASVCPIIKPLDKKFCFIVNISSKIDNEKQASFKNWGAIAVDSSGVRHNIEWSPKSLNKKPTSKKIPSYYGGKNQWFNEGKGCTKPFKMEKGFVVKLTPLAAPFHLSGDIELKWQFDEYKIVDGKKIKIKKKNAAKQPYRDW